MNSQQLEQERIDAYNRTEQQVLAAMLRYPDCIGDVVGILRAEHFRTYHHRLVFDAIVTLWNDNRTADAAAVANLLLEREQIADLGGYGFLGELAGMDCVTTDPKHHAEQVRDWSRIRSLRLTADEIASEVERGDKSADELLESAERKIYAIAETGYSGGAVRIRQSLKETFDRIEERERRKGEIGGIPTGLLGLDTITCGLHDSELTILAARTSVGKTTLALQITKHAAITLGLPVLFVSLEMSRVELTERLLCAIGKVDNWRLRLGKHTNEDNDRLWEARRQMDAQPLFIADESEQRMMQIAATARRLKRQEGLRLLVVDYVGLVTPDNPKLPRHEQVSEVSRRLKGLAKELNIPVLALSQLSRAAEEKDRPKLHHLRESGSLEQDADCVLLMHRPDSQVDVIEVEIAKQRSGPTGGVKLVFEKKYTRFSNCIDGIPFGE